MSVHIPKVGSDRHYTDAAALADYVHHLFDAVHIRREILFGDNSGGIKKNSDKHEGAFVFPGECLVGESR